MNDAAMTDAAGEGGSGGTDSGSKPDASEPEPMQDAGIDAGVDSGTTDSSMPDAATSGSVPEDWVCLAALWNDGVCDCGCGIHDADCFGQDCIEPGCIATYCDACFTAEHTWKTCAPAPDPNDWACDPAMKEDTDSCDCGCGIPDPFCSVDNCTTPGCRKPLCDSRNKCGPGVTSNSDECSVTPNTLRGGFWKCPWDSYGGDDGCDCGCGALDPDCAGAGCTAGQCYAAQCDTCHDNDGRPYDCFAAKAGWDDNIEQSGDASYCNPLHFDSGDGCDCGCGGQDPDCGQGHGCEVPDCYEAACDRCTDSGGHPIGCAPPSEWLNACPVENYGTGDGCDCGCGVDDPDCGNDGSPDPDHLSNACDVCHDGLGVGPQHYIKCPTWNCSDAAWGTAECDCGCGAIDPYCRDTSRRSCTAPDCDANAVCDYCNDAAGNRTECGPTWGAGGTTCNLPYYDLDGLCDCGCGAPDPDCGSDGCTEQGCSAPGCDVCHQATQIGVCDPWSPCHVEDFNAGDGVCDCGCGAIDPDCGSGGCKGPGCSDDACDVCHDPHGRDVPCP